MIDDFDPALSGDMFLRFADDEGNEYPEQAALDGYHVNIRADEPISELEGYRVYPNNPVRVWL